MRSWGHNVKTRPDTDQPAIVDRPTPHIPKRHKLHSGDKPCGCWTGKGGRAVCPYCGASYEYAEVLSFPIWHCYDCQASLRIQIP